jgi:hypothetical protein
MKILNQLPVLERVAEERFGDRYIRSKRHQILIWVAIHTAGQPSQV